MNNLSLIAGKDPMGALSWRDVFNGVCVGLPVFLGVYGAEVMESTVSSAIAVGSGLILSLVLMRVLGGRRMADTRAETSRKDQTSRLDDDE